MLSFIQNAAKDWKHTICWSMHQSEWIANIQSELGMLIVD